MVYLNQESTSIWHDYTGHGRGLVLATIPVIAHVGRSEADYLELFATVAATSADDTALADQLAAVYQIRRRRLHRTMLERQRSPERFRTWTQPTTLATTLLQAQTTRLAEQDKEIEEAATVVRDALEGAMLRSRQLQADRDATLESTMARARQLQADHDAKLDRRLRLLSPIAGLAVVATIFTAFASVPNQAGEAVLLGLPWAAIITGALSVAGLLIGWAILTWRARTGPADTKTKRRDK